MVNTSGDSHLSTICVNLNHTQISQASLSCFNLFIS